jgi:hypothetical protein
MTPLTDKAEAGHQSPSPVFRACDAVASTNRRSTSRCRVECPVIARALTTMLILLSYPACAVLSGPEQMRFGVLGTSCDPHRLEAERAAGIDTVVLDLSWVRYLPEPHVVNQTYVREIQAQVDACREAGMRIVLSVGLQYPPNWVRHLPSGTFVNEAGTSPRSGEVDLVFSAAVRTAVAQLYRRIAADIGFDGIHAVRLGTNLTGEFGYPRPEAGDDTRRNSYWAFSRAAQTGSGLADGQVPSPMPGWYPGTSAWRGRHVQEQQVREWFSWYATSLVHAVRWQAEMLRTAGFRGDFHIPVAGRGVLPTDFDAAAAARLDGRNNPDDALELGLFYPEQFSLIAQYDQWLRSNSAGSAVYIDFTGIDDDTAVRARRLDPPQDACTAEDVAAAVAGHGLHGWSAQKWVIANARRYGLSVVGEIPGRPDAPFTGGSPDSDSLADQLRRGARYAKDCGLQLFLFAFEDDLFSGTPQVSLEDYQREIAAIRGERRAT